MWKQNPQSGNNAPTRVDKKRETLFKLEIPQNCEQRSKTKCVYMLAGGIMDVNVIESAFLMGCLAIIGLVK